MDWARDPGRMPGVVRWALGLGLFMAGLVAIRRAGLGADWGYDVANTAFVVLFGAFAFPWMEGNGLRVPSRRTAAKLLAALVLLTLAFHYL